MVDEKKIESEFNTFTWGAKAMHSYRLLLEYL